MIVEPPLFKLLPHLTVTFPETEVSAVILSPFAGSLVGADGLPAIYE